MRSANAEVMQRLGVNRDGSVYASEAVTREAAAVAAARGARAVQFDACEGSVGTAAESVLGAPAAAWKGSVRPPLSA